MSLINELRKAKKALKQAGQRVMGHVPTYHVGPFRHTSDDDKRERERQKQTPSLSTAPITTPEIKAPTNISTAQEEIKTITTENQTLRAELKTAEAKIITMTQDKDKEQKRLHDEAQTQAEGRNFALNFIMRRVKPETKAYLAQDEEINLQLTNNNTSLTDPRTFSKNNPQAFVTGMEEMAKLVVSRCIDDEKYFALANLLNREIKKLKPFKQQLLLGNTRDTHELFSTLAQGLTHASNTFALQPPTSTASVITPPHLTLQATDSKDAKETKAHESMEHKTLPSAQTLAKHSMLNQTPRIDHKDEKTCPLSTPQLAEELDFVLVPRYF